MVNIVPGIFTIPLKFVKHYKLCVNKCKIYTDIDLLPNIQCHVSVPSTTHTQILTNKEEITDGLRGIGLHTAHFIIILLQDIVKKSKNLKY
jgi:hypothetical protein